MLLPFIDYLTNELRGRLLQVLDHLLAQLLIPTNIADLTDKAHLDNIRCI